MKENLAVIFGGNCSEHDISIISALQAMQFVDKNYYNVIPIYIAKNGIWYVGKQLFDLQNFENINLKKLKKVSLVCGNNFLHKKTLFGYVKHLKLDCALIVMHGMNGEDGKVMSIMELCNIPYTSTAPTESGVCLDKSIFKYCMKGLNINNVEGLTVIDADFKNNPSKVLNNIEKTLGFPLIVKPATQGSSIGITVCKTHEELEQGLILSFELCEKALIEKYLENITEVNVAIIKNNNELLVSELEQPIKSKNILSFENKYLNESNALDSVSRIIPANISENQKETICEMAKQIYSTLNLRGVVRFDFIISNDVIYINEVNTIPGSLAYYLFKPLNISYEKLLNILIKEAYVNYENSNKKNKNFETNILSKGVVSIKK